jgi:hypothetical protein
MATKADVQKLINALDECVLTLEHSCPEKGAYTDRLAKAAKRLVRAMGMKYGIQPSDKSIVRQSPRRRAGGGYEGGPSPRAKSTSPRSRCFKETTIRGVHVRDS